MTETVVRVASGSRPNQVAGAIAHLVRKHSQVVVRAIGAQATSQAIKAIAIASRYLGFNLACVPEFTVVQIDGQEKTAIVFSVLPLDERRTA